MGTLSPPLTLLPIRPLKLFPERSPLRSMPPVVYAAHHPYAWGYGYGLHHPLLVAAKPAEEAVAEARKKREAEAEADPEALYYGYYGGYYGYPRYGYYGGYC